MREQDLGVPSGRVSRSDELQTLAARCEREEPSRKLDAEIAAACRIVFGFDFGTLSYPADAAMRADEDGRVAILAKQTTYPERPSHQLVHIRPSACFTSSLDAAVTLVPPRTWFPADLNFDGEDFHFSLILGVAGEEIVYGVAATEPMARCAAALRARATLAENVQAADTRGKANPS